MKSLTYILIAVIILILPQVSATIRNILNIRDGYSVEKSVAGWLAKKICKAK